MTDIAISVQNLSKCFQIYENPRDRLKQFVFPRIQRYTGKEPKQYFKEFWALKDVSFEVEKGQTVGIVGQNGSGKSTLLQLICGTLNPTIGSVETNGRIAALLELGSGFNPEFTGRENVFMNATVLGLSQKEIDARFDDILAFADIGEFIERPVKTYSSGMLVRLAFAVQASVDPDILVVDEALAVGDEKFQRKCFARLEDLKSKGSSILFVSHSPASIIELCDKTLFLHYGERLMYEKAPKSISAYQKLIYTPLEQQKSLIEEYRRIDLCSGFLDSTNHGDLSYKVDNQNSLDCFEPGLVPETTTIYPVQGAEIESFKILDMDGEVVNLLHLGGMYQLELSGRFIQDFMGVHFAFHFRSVSGLVITGQRYPEEGKFFNQAKTGQSFKIIFAFKMDLLPGVYFVGGGIWSSQEPSCAHRIMDAIMFRVMPLKRSNSFGYVDISIKEPNFELL
jgi:lipopolysaccharide transport system ATP-binding protein